MFICDYLNPLQRDCLIACTITKGHLPESSQKRILPKGSFYRHSFDSYVYAKESTDLFAVFVNDSNILIAFRGTDFTDDIRLLGKPIFTEQQLAILSPELRAETLANEIKNGFPITNYSDAFTDLRIAKGYAISPLHSLAFTMVKHLLQQNERPVVLTGASMGAHIALYVARIYEGVNGVSLPVVTFSPALCCNIGNHWYYNNAIAFREVNDPISSFSMQYVPTVSYVLSGSSVDTHSLFHDIQSFMSTQTYENITGLQNIDESMDTQKHVVQIIQ